MNYRWLYVTVGKSCSKKIGAHAVCSHLDFATLLSLAIHMQYLLVTVRQQHCSNLSCCLSAAAPALVAIEPPEVAGMLACCLVLCTHPFVTGPCWLQKILLTQNIHSDSISLSLT